MVEIHFAGALPSAPLHCKQPTPMLAAIVEQNGHILLARNAAWKGRMFTLIKVLWRPKNHQKKGLPERSWAALKFSLANLWRHSFKRMNQVIITYHVRTTGKCPCLRSWQNTSDKTGTDSHFERECRRSCYLR